MSRQKTIYIRGPTQAIKNREPDLERLEKLSNDEIREILVQLKGIGNRTVNVYLMFVLQRADVFPISDLAAVNALKRLKQLESSATKEQILEIAKQWQPFRSVASMML